VISVTEEADGIPECWFSWEAANNLDRTHDCGIEGIKILCRNPVLQVGLSACIFHVVAIDEAPPDLEAGYKSGTARRNIPIACNLHCVLLGEYGIENWLFGQARRKGSHASLPDQIKLLGADRPPKGECLLVSGHVCDYEKNAIFSAWLIRRIGASGSLAATAGLRTMPLAMIDEPSEIARAGSGAAAATGSGIG
jgi:hypothetical protein